jgi:hypothetical protein
MLLTEENQNTRRQTVPMPICQPQTLQGLWPWIESEPLISFPTAEIIDNTQGR